MSSRWLFGLGLLSLGLGALIYVVLRPEGSSYLSQHISLYQPLPYVPLINNLPSFFHVFAFSLLSASVIHQTRYGLYSCVFWLIINLGFEVVQHPLLTDSIDNPSTPIFLKRYAAGTFDVMDILASIFGFFLAYRVMTSLQRRGK